MNPHLSRSHSEVSYAVPLSRSIITFLSLFIPGCVSFSPLSISATRNFVGAPQSIVPTASAATSPEDLLEMRIIGSLTQTC